MIAGSRRLRAVSALRHSQQPEIQLAGIIVDLDDEQAFGAAEAENVGRQALTPIQRARSWRWLCDHVHGGDQNKLAEAVGKDEAVVSRTLSLLELPDCILRAHSDPERLTVNFAAAIMPALRDEQRREGVERAAETLVDNKMRLAGPRLIERLLLTPADAEALRPLLIAAGTSERQAVWKRERDGSANLRIRALSPDLTLQEKRALFQELRRQIHDHLGLAK